MALCCCECKQAWSAANALGMMGGGGLDWWGKLTRVECGYPLREGGGGHGQEKQRVRDDAHFVEEGGMIHAVGVGRGTVGGRREWWAVGICLGLSAHEHPITVKTARLGLCVRYWLSLEAMWIHVNLCCLCCLSRSCMHPDHVNRPLNAMLCQQLCPGSCLTLQGTPCFTGPASCLFVP